jgi:predicted transcriptional regulator of viral defense system
MHPILRFAELAYLQSRNLRPLLRDYTNPDDLIARLVKSGELVRLKNGFFVIAEKIANAPVPYEPIANLLYGPSYISFEWALSYYQMIPEGVYVVTSASTGRSRTFKTPIGTFDYQYLGHQRYAVGIDQQEKEGSRFLIATREKALADLIHLKSPNLSGKELLEDLIEARRMEESDLKQLDKKHLQEIADRYSSIAVQNLIHVIGLL